MTRLQGVCGVEHEPHGCGAEFVLTAEFVTVVRWLGQHPSREWYVVGRCPACDYACVAARCTRTDARAWVCAGAASVEMDHPVELDHEGAL